MITVDQYFMGRRETHPLSMSPTIQANSERLVPLVNALLEKAQAAGVPEPPINPNSGSQVSSGWRPPDVNAATPGAATNSKHMTGQACDIYDPQRKLGFWVQTEEGMAALKEIGLWIENPQATKTWLHVQDLPPASGSRCFWP